MPARVSGAGGQVCRRAACVWRACSEGRPAEAYSRAEGIAPGKLDRSRPAPLLFPSVLCRFFRADLTKQQFATRA